jgi:murein DD-endopeptidase MepM/ murein hydrolase activator NlpD
MKNKIISILVICILLISTSKLAFAETSAEYKQKSEDAKEKLEDVTGQINTALQEVQDLNTSIDNTEQEITNLTKEVTDLNQSISEKEKDLAEKQKLLEERLVASYMNGKNTYMDALFSGGLANFVSNYESIKQIAEYDNNLMADVKNTKTELENERNKVETAKKEKETKSAELKKLKSEKEAKVNNLTDEQKQIQAQMDEYDSQMKILEQKEKAIAEAAKRKAEQEKSNNSNKNNNTGSNNNGGSTTPTGTFQWPVPSSHTITSNYGYRIHPISGTKKLHAGIDIGAPGGSNIVAADAGTVVLSSFGYNGGYGNYVIISHGNGITTRYAHCSNLFVSAGESVSKGQVIAAVGSTGASTGNHCHFEVRINGGSKNPLNYL